MAVSEDFIEFILEQLSLLGEVSARKMFGGVGIYRDHLMFALIFEDTLFMKVDEYTKEKYIEAGSTAFKPFGGDTAIRSFLEVPADIIDNQEELAAWALEAIAVQAEAKR